MENMNTQNTVAETVREYAIPECNMDSLQRKLTRVRNKCARYGCEFQYAEMGEEFREITDDDGKKMTVRYVKIRTSGHALIDGWQYIATVEHTENGNIFHTAADVEIPSRYYCSDPYCEHCQTNRRRTETYIIMETETGAFKQVGKNCLYDYTHGLNAEFIAAFEQYFKELENMSESLSLERSTRYLDVREFLAYSAETIRTYGYLKSDCPPSMKCTRDRVTEFYGLDHGWYNGKFDEPVREKIRRDMEKVNFQIDRPCNAEKVTAAVDWISAQEDRGNYIHNLKVACGLTFAEVGNAGILCSLFAAYDRELERLAEKAAREARLAAQREAEKVSEYVGEIGKRIEFKPVYARVVTSWENTFSPYGGVTYIWKIKDGDGNVYTWKTSNEFREDRDGETVLPETIKGTVKAHTEYRDVKQTELTRCKLNY